MNGEAVRCVKISQAFGTMKRFRVTFELPAALSTQV